MVTARLLPAPVLEDASWKSSRRALPRVRRRRCRVRFYGLVAMAMPMKTLLANSFCQASKTFPAGVFDHISSHVAVNSSTC